MSCESLRTLANDVAAACKTVLGTDAIDVISRCRTAWDDDGSGQFAMCVGTIHEYRIVRVEYRCLFGWRWLKYKKRHWLVRFGGDEFFNDGYLRKPWCEVYDPQLAEAVRPLVESWLGPHAALCGRDKLTFDILPPT